MQQNELKYMFESMDSMCDGQHAHGLLQVYMKPTAQAYQQQNIHKVYHLT